MLDAQREKLVDKIHDEAESQETRQELGDQSAEGRASGMSAPDLPRGPQTRSNQGRVGNSQTSSDDTSSTQGSTFVDDDATVSSLGDPEGTYDLGAPAEAGTQQTRTESFPPTNRGIMRCDGISQMETQ